jgi:hypothetical protein
MKTKPSTSRKRQGVFPLPRGWFAVVHDENGKLRQLGVFRTKRDATSVFHTVTAQRLVEMIAREIDALPFRGERTLVSFMTARSPVRSQPSSLKITLLAAALSK